MTRAHLYTVDLKSADTATASTAFAQAQKKITTSVKRSIKKVLEENDLAGEFAFVDKKVSNLSRSFQIYASPRAAKVLQNDVPGIKNVRQLTSSSLPLSINF